MPEVAGQPAQPPGVLRGHHVGAAQLGRQPRRRVLGPPDRGAGEHQDARPGPRRGLGRIGHGLDHRSRSLGQREPSPAPPACSSGVRRSPRRRGASELPPAASRARLPGSDRVRGWVAALGVFALALALRLWDLGNPKAFAFDETYYAKDAWSLRHFGYVQSYVEDADKAILGGQTTGLWTGDPSMVVHPELGKWLIALGESAFGMTPFGWRVSSAVVGALMVLVMVRLARRLTRSTAARRAWPGCCCASTACTSCCPGWRCSTSSWRSSCCARSPASSPTATGPGSRLADLVGGDPARGRATGARRLLWRPWRLAAGVCWGLASRRSGRALFPLAAFGLTMWLWDAGARRSFGVRWAVARSALLDAVPALAYVVLLPLVIYLLSWTGWLLHADVYERALSDTQYGPYWGSYLEQRRHRVPPRAVAVAAVAVALPPRRLLLPHPLPGRQHPRLPVHPVGLVRAQPPGRHLHRARHRARRAGLHGRRRVDVPAPGAAAGQPGGVVGGLAGGAVVAGRPGCSAATGATGWCWSVWRRPGCRGSATPTARSSATTPRPACRSWCWR